MTAWPLAALLLAPPTPAGAEALNVILITLDAVRADHVGAYGYARRTTPAIDALARRGTLFQRAYAQAPWTLPSLSSLWTSRYGESHRAVGPKDSLEPGAETMAALLGRRGYRTAAFVHGLPLDPALGLTRGFGSVYRSPNSRFMGHLAEKASEWIQANSAGPFFVWIHGFDAHFPYLCPRGDRERYDPGYRGPVHGWDIDRDTELHGRFVGHFNGEARARKNPPYAFDAKLWDFARELRESPRDIAHFTAHYDGCIHSMDKAVADLRGRVEGASPAAKTLWIVTADHGENLGVPVGGRPPRLSHPMDDMHEALLRVPLIVAHPTRWRGRKVAEPVMLADVLPTLLGLLGLPPLSGAQGADLGPWLDGARREPPHPGAYASSLQRDGRWTRALMGGDWKLLFHGGAWSLYDLRSDPEESADVSVSRPAEFLEMGRRLLDQMAQAQGAGKGGAQSSTSRR